MEKVIVEIINESPKYPIPYGKNYEARGHTDKEIIL